MPTPVPVPWSAAAERNKAPILALLRGVLPARGEALEIASGSGQHVECFAALPGWRWQPSEADAATLAGLAQRFAASPAPGVRAPLRLDVMEPEWPTEGPPFAAAFDAVYCANLLHIAPWAACTGLMRGAARHLAPGGVLVTYGPYLEDGVPTAPGNLAFDHSLRTRNPDWGLRRLDAVAQEAAHAGLALRERHAMPANNLLLVWQRMAPPRPQATLGAPGQAARHPGRFTHRPNGTP